MFVQLRTLYVVCYKIETDKSGDFKGIFYPVSIFISCFFLFLTIFVYIILRELRSNIFGKITLGFLGNVFIWCDVYCYSFPLQQHLFCSVTFSWALTTLLPSPTMRESSSIHRFVYSSVRDRSKPLPQN